MKESDVQKCITDYLAAERIPCWRMNAGNGGNFRMKGHEAGTADLLATPYLRYLGNFKAPALVWIETKAPGARTKPETAKAQQEFCDYVKSQGHYYIKASDVETVQQFIRDRK